MPWTFQAGAEHMQDRAADNRVAGDTGAENIAAENKRDFERAAEAVDRRRLDWKPVLPAVGSNFVRP